MKVCHVATVDLSVRFLLLNQLLHLKREGMNVHAVCSDGPWLPEVESSGIVVHRVAMKRSMAPLSDLAALASLILLFRRERFDLVHLHTPKGALLGGLASRMARIPHVVYTIHGFYFHEGMRPLARRFYEFWERIVSFCVDFALSQNRADVDMALRAGSYRHGEIEFLGNGIDVRRFDPDAIPKATMARIRRSLGIPENGRVLGIVARLVEEKGYPELFRALRMLLDEFPDLYVLAVGPQDEAKADSLSPETARMLGVAHRVVFTGMRLDLPELYAAMDIFVLPSRREGFPRVVMEASSMALPVVASDIRGCREAVEDGVTGMLFPVRDAEGLAGAVARFLRDPDLANAMGANGRRKARSEFDEARVFARVVRTYKRLCGNTA